ncbi:MAG: plasmid mobilization relaxosome protein MobC [Parvimonas sp.]|nr:plasmid mobilization relaxosome protein MobC [Parvimonas sp.]
MANNNLNQITRQINRTGVIYKMDIKEIKKDIAKISKELLDIHSLLLKRTKELNIYIKIGELVMRIMSSVL